MDKKILFLIVLGIVMFSIRLANINEAIYDDESNFAYSLTVMDKYGFNPDYPSSQLHNLIYKPFIALFGLETWVFRLIPWLFGMINTVLVYVFAKRNWNDRVAFWATLLMLISFYPTLAALQFDIEGNLIMFLVLLMFFSFLEAEKLVRHGQKERNRKIAWQLLAGISLGAAIASKYNTVYIGLILVLYALFKNGLSGAGTRKTVSSIFLIIATGLAVFIFSVLVGFLLPTATETVTNSTHFFSWYDGFIAKYRPDGMSLLGLAMLVLWSTPLLFGFYLLSLVKRNREITLLWTWITVAILFYTFILTYGSLDRYFMNTIPAMAMLGGFYLSRSPFTNRQLKFGALATVFITALFFAINSLPFKYIARFPSLYFKELSQGNLNFLFSYTSASGPTFGINFTVLFIAFMLGFGCLFLCLLSRRRNLDTSSWFFVLFLVISLSFNIFLTAEYLFHPTGVEVSDVKWQMIDYVEDNNLPNPLYTNDQGIQWYFEHDYLWQNKITGGFGDNELGSNNPLVLKRIQKEGGTILLLHWPPLPNNSPAWEITTLCHLNKKFYSKEVLIGEVYICSK